MSNRDFDSPPLPVQTAPPPVQTANQPRNAPGSEGTPSKSLGSPGSMPPGSGRRVDTMDSTVSAPSASTASWFKRVAAAMAIVALAVVVGRGVFFKGGAEDHVTDQQKQSWAAAFAAAQPIRLSQVAPAEVAPAIAAMPLPQAQQQQLQADVETGRTRLVWISLQDVEAEDGDQIRVQSGEYSEDVILMHAVKKVVVPEPPSGVINVQGLHDGGGGITVGITSGGVPINLPYMTEGQTVGIPVVITP